MNLTNFQEIKSWQKARELSIQIYKEFWNMRDFGFRDQITRASVSVMNNIAEGYGRSNNKEFLRFLSYSKASAIEVQSMLILSQDLSYTTTEKFNQLYKISEETLNLIGGFINYLKNHSSTNPNQKPTEQLTNRITEKPNNPKTKKHNSLGKIGFVSKSFEEDIEDYSQ